MRKNIANKEKQVIGNKCCNCGSEKDLEYHHIVPIALGGNDIISNLVCLCYGCHSLIHHGDKKQINHSELIKSALRKSKKRLGKAKKTLFVPNEVSNRYQQFIKGGFSKVAYAKMCNISRPTLDKYLKVMKCKELLLKEGASKKFIENYQLYENGKINKEDFSKILNLSIESIDKYEKIIESI